MPFIDVSSSLDSSGEFNAGVSSTTCHEWHKWWEMLRWSQAAGGGTMGPVIEVLLQVSYEVVHAAKPLEARGNCLGLLDFCHSLTIYPQREVNNFFCTEALLSTFCG